MYKEDEENLGIATTLELLEELEARCMKYDVGRIQVSTEEWPLLKAIIVAKNNVPKYKLEYRTVDG